MFISVIIPTYNRKHILKICLEALFNQTYSKDDFEIIIVDDGSTDGTDEFINSIKKNYTNNLFYFKQHNRGPASARNMGITNAKGKILLFIGDDIIPTVNLLYEHLETHRYFSKDNFAVLGYTTWSPEIKITNFMRWLEKDGMQFGYSLIKDPNNVPYDFFYTSNISVKRDFLSKYGFFDEEFIFAAFEDIELAYRLTNFGLRIIYNEKAVAYHMHKVIKKTYAKRLRMIGGTMKLFHQKHPKLREKFKCINKPKWREFIKWILPSFAEKFISLESLYGGYRYMSWYYISQGYMSSDRFKEKC